MFRMIRLSLPSLSKVQSPVRAAPLFQQQRRLSTHGGSITQVNEIPQNALALSTQRMLYGFRTFSASRDLAAKKCVPCDAKDLKPMTEETANHLSVKVPEWKLVNDNGVLKLRRSWKVKSFLKGLEMFKLVAALAETEGHHPDLHLVGWNNVTIEIWTHAVGGLTENDFILAAKIDQLQVQDLLRMKPKP